MAPIRGNGGDYVAGGRYIPPAIEEAGNSRQKCWPAGRHPRCNGFLFHFARKAEPMPRKQRRRSFASFDKRSVMLFAALTVGGALAQAQTPASPSAQPRVQAGPASGTPAAAGALKRANARHGGQED